MPSTPLRGIIAPLPTPFDPATDTPSRAGLTRITEHLVAAGLNGIVTAGSTGEGELLDDNERVQLVDWLRPLVPDAMWLIAGTGSESTRGAINASKAAAAAGADAVLVRAPAYYGSGLPTAGFTGHYLRLADASPIPVIIYNIPKYTHVALAPEVLATCSAHPNVAGFKDSSGDFAVFTAYRAAAPTLAAFVGSGLLVQRALAHGAAGGVLAVACFAAETCVALYRAHCSGDLVTAAELQRCLEPLAQEIVGRLGPAGIKVAMEAAGLPGGAPRAPLIPIAANQREAVMALVTTYAATR